MKDHPYQNLPERSYWRRAVSNLSPHDVDPVVEAPFKIRRSHQVATAGSCFAQHIARYLRSNGFGYLVTEKPHTIINREDAAAYNYGMFTARYGNLYTARQLLQLFDRAYGQFQPADDIWRDEHGKYIDPFCPQIQPDGFHSQREYEADRSKYFRCVREAFHNFDVFIFTLGLTETWRSREDGAVYPLCPGVAGGRFDENVHEFYNFCVDEVVRDVCDFIFRLREVNKRSRVILTVSPVPLIATATAKHVLVSNTYSKSVLRVAADQITRTNSNVFCFPSYEIITGYFSRGAYFGKDCRSITEKGVAHVMRLFLRHFADVELLDDPQSLEQATDGHTIEMERLIKFNCDEEALDGA